MIDYGLKSADYIGAFFKNINWKAVEARLKKSDDHEEISGS
jgi:Fe-Mn family superoxide dismutase